MRLSVDDDIKAVDWKLAASRLVTINITKEQVKKHVLKVAMDLRSFLSETEIPWAKEALRKYIDCLVLTPIVEDGRIVAITA